VHFTLTLMILQTSALIYRRVSGRELCKRLLSRCYLGHLARGTFSF
jgi:hypothetical protein